MIRPPARRRFAGGALRLSLSTAGRATPMAVASRTGNAVFHWPRQVLSATVTAGVTVSVRDRARDRATGVGCDSAIWNPDPMV